MMFLFVYEFVIVFVVCFNVFCCFDAFCFVLFPVVPAFRCVCLFDSVFVSAVFCSVVDFVCAVIICASLLVCASLS